ncbi:hypothetical protein [Candidatus Nitrospira nitrificans]|uniref:Uncharacterized protein n=1 Tax=Candidatus Nitrospira nitrificans TaxID=1742973 RepID=A0A0S4L6B4_9BACT|nr:hypothetical protein [Candidatus Nitrospira nitrificans]CUS31316.1 exported hypothetical protein [Candidatus Nitrospira nitrificans]
MRFLFPVPVLSFAICLLANACGLTNTKVVDEMLVDNPRGAVFLQKAEDGWFGTAHPLAMSPAFLASVFRGVHVKATERGQNYESPVFSDDDTEFLTPLISTALSQAVRSQVVGFRVSRDTDMGSETTGGILYIQGRLLHLTFTHYRAQRDRASPAGMSARIDPNPTGLNTRQLGFVPESARRSSRNTQPDVTKTPPIASLVIEYEAIPAWLAPSSTQPQPQLDQAPVIPRHNQSIHSTRDAAASHNTHVAPGTENSVQAPGSGKETELETLKEKVRTLQRRLLELEGNTQRK